MVDNLLKGQDWKPIQDKALEKMEKTVLPGGCSEAKAKGFKRGGKKDLLDEQGNKIGEEDVQEIVIHFDPSSCDELTDKPQEKPDSKKTEVVGKTDTKKDQVCDK